MNRVDEWIAENLTFEDTARPTVRRNVLDAAVAKLLSERDEAAAKWQKYEQGYILPCFKWAEESGLDLREAVSDNPGRNCVEILVRWLQGRGRAAEAYAGTIDGVREALGQKETHYLVVADDVEELVKAVERCESDGGCQAMTVLAKLRGR
jgi:hypothetical protein